MQLGIDPKVDYAFKRLFGVERNRDLLIDLIHAILRPAPEERIASIELLNPFNEKDALDDKLSVVDIKARDQAGRLYNVEMQMLGSLHFPKRLLYYATRIHQQQLHEGDAYGELRPTIVICFLNDVLYPQLDDIQLTFRCWDQQHRVVLTDDLAIHLLELPKFRKTASEITDPRDRWLYFLRHAESLDDKSLPAEIEAPTIRKAVEELKMLTQNDLERERYEARLKLQRDAISNQQSAEQTGHRRGLEQGLREGLKKGELIGVIHFCEAELVRDLTPTDELIALSESELSQRADALKLEIRRST